MARYKGINGATLRARTLDRQEVEALIGCVMLNTFDRLGKPDTVKVDVIA